MTKPSDPTPESAGTSAESDRAPRGEDVGPLSWETDFVEPSIESRVHEGRREVIVFGATTDGKVVAERSWVDESGRRVRTIESPPASPRHWPLCVCAHPRVVHRDRGHDGGCRVRGCKCESYGPDRGPSRAR